jgi:hypothetical protein
MIPPTSPRLTDVVLVERGQNSWVVSGRDLRREIESSDEASALGRL